MNYTPSHTDIQAQHKRHQWPYWLLGAVAALVLLLAALLTFGPGLVKSQAMKHGSALLQHPVTIDALEFSFSPISVSARGIAIHSKDNQLTEVSVDTLKLDVRKLNPFNKQFSATLHVDSLQWKNQAGALLLVAQTIRAPIDRADLKTLNFDFGAIQLDGLNITVARNPSGQINLLTAVDTLLAELPQKPVADPPSPAPTWSVNGVVLENAQITFLDQLPFAPKKTVTLHQAIHRLQIGAFQHTFDQAVPIQLDGQINQTGTIQLVGTVQPQPLAVELQFKAQQFSLPAIQAYVEEHLALGLKSGTVDTQGVFKFSKQKPQQTQIALQGDLNVQDFASTNADQSEPLLNWKRLSLQGIDLQLGQAAPKFSVSKIQLEDFFARLILSQQGQLNVLEIVRTKPAASGQRDPAQPSPSSSKSTGQVEQNPALHVGDIIFKQGRVLFSDRFIKPNYTANISDVAGHIRGLSSRREDLAEMSLNGTYNRVSPVTVDARLNMLADQRFLDLSAKVKGIEMTSFNPYAGHYAGYNIEKGKLSLDLRYHLKDQALQAENKVFLDQLTFGDKVDSPNATSLPVRLAVALLKNRKGEIDINLPISGSLDDPQFSIGGILWQVIGNLIVKAVAAPFSLIASLFDSPDDLSSLDFAPGLATLREADQKRLDIIATALREKPSLHLEITGWADPVTDEAALRADKSRKGRIDASTLPQLAQRRAQTVQLWLIEKGQIPAERVFLLPGKVSEAITPSNTPKSEPSTPSATRVDFSLR